MDSPANSYIPGYSGSLESSEREGRSVLSGDFIAAKRKREKDLQGRRAVDIVVGKIR